MKSGQIWAAGMQDLSKSVAAAAQVSLDESMAAFKALTSVKSLKDAFELQSSFAVRRSRSPWPVGRADDASLKLTEQALAPITARVKVASSSSRRPPNQTPARPSGRAEGEWVSGPPGSAKSFHLIKSGRPGHLSGPFVLGLLLSGKRPDRSGAPRCNIRVVWRLE